MADRPIVILHGWSDVSESFEPLASLLRQELQEPKVLIVSLADYLSMEDEVRFDDLVTAMNAAWTKHKLPRTPRSVDAIVHSTGGLVIRDWLHRNFTPSEAPVKNLVMLAPANFGSPLAHKGRSLIARAWKGFVANRPNGDPFETGTRILKGLELASPYTWQLAERDRFGDGGEMYAPGNVLCTVLVGDSGYKGIRAIANENGTDGTVRVSTANMQCARVKATFPANPSDQNVGHDVEYEMEDSTGLTAFGVIHGHNHGSIKLSHCGTEEHLEIPNKDGALFKDIVFALRVSDDDFGGWCHRLSIRNDELLSKAAKGRNRARYGFQNTVIRVEDQYGVGVDDYLLEFYEKDDDRGRLAEAIHTSTIEKVHKYCDDASYRSVYIDCTRLRRIVDKVGEFLSVSITAYPELGDRSPVGFTTLGDDGIGGIRIGKEDIGCFFVPHRTMLMTLTLTRQQLPKTFRFRKY